MFFRKGKTNGFTEQIFKVIIYQNKGKKPCFGKKWNLLFTKTALKKSLLVKNRDTGLVDAGG